MNAIQQFERLARRLDPAADVVLDEQVNVGAWLNIVTHDRREIAIRYHPTMGYSFYFLKPESDALAGLYGVADIRMATAAGARRVLVSTLNAKVPVPRSTTRIKASA